MFDVSAAQLSVVRLNFGLPEEKQINRNNKNYKCAKPNVK